MRTFFFWNDDIVLDNSVRSRERTIVPMERRPALLTVLFFIFQLEKYQIKFFCEVFFSDLSMNTSSFDGFNVVKERRKQPRFPAFAQETKLPGFPAFAQETEQYKFPSFIQEKPGNNDQISFQVTEPGNISVDISDTVDVDVYPFIKSNMSENGSEEVNSTNSENTR